MKLTKFKLLAAGFMLTCGLALTGVGLMPKVDAQVGAGGPPGGRPGAGGGVPGSGAGALPGGGGLGPSAGSTGLPLGGSTGAGNPGGMAGEGEGAMGGMMGGAPTARAAFEYLFVAKPGTLSEVAVVLRGKAMQNWEYTGPLDVDPTDPKGTAGIEGVTKTTRVVLVFKRHAPTGMPGMGSMGGGMMPGGSGMGAPGGMSVAELERRFQEYDLNKDDKISREEAAQNKRLAERFEQYDTNRDGTITSSEYMSGAAMRMSGGPGMGSNSLSLLGGLAPGGSGTAPEKSGEVYQVYRLKNAKAADAAKVIGEVFNGPNATPEKARVRVVAETNSNSIIVTKASPADLKVIEDLLAKTIDVKLVEPPKNALPVEGGEGGGTVGGKQTKVFKLKHAVADEVASSVMSSYTDARGKGASANLALMADATNSITAVGYADDLKFVERTVTLLDFKRDVQSAMFKITEVAPTEAAKAFLAIVTEAGFKGVEVTGADSFATLIVNAPTAGTLDDVRKLIRAKYPKATEVKPGGAVGR